MRVHPVADLFPMLSEDELADLAADIKANGLIHPIVLDAKGETLIDGRNRLEACKRAGIEPRFNRLNGEDPWAYTISANVKRRNLTPGQRAYAAAMAWTAAEADGRVQAKGGDRKSNGQNTHLIADPRVYFAKQFGTSDKYVRLVRDLLAPVDDGGDPAAARRTALGQALPARPPIATSGATSPRARRRAYAAAMAWTAAEAEGRVQKQGARTDREPLGKIPKGLITDPRTFFAKQFGSNEKYIRLVRDLLAPVDDGGDPAAARRTALGQALPARPPIATSGATSPRARRRAYAAAMAWTAAEAEGRVLKGRPAKGGQNTQLISEPRVYFAKQFGTSEKYVRLVRDLLAPAAELGRPWRRTDE